MLKDSLSSMLLLFDVLFLLLMHFLADQLCDVELGINLHNFPSDSLVVAISFSGRRVAETLGSLLMEP